MRRTRTLDWPSFMRGKVITSQSAETQRAILQGLAIAGVVAIMTDFVVPHEVGATVDAMAQTESAQLDQMHFDSDASWADYVVPLIRHQALPLAVTMVCWAALEMILRKPSSALDRAKWAVGGYIGMQFVLPFLRNLGHHFGDV